MRTRVKICGITRSEDIDIAVAAGVDALGFVFYPPSPRAVSIEQAAKLCAKIPAFVIRVGLFVDAAPDEVNAVLASVPLSLLQFHGSESASYCESFARPYLKAVKIAAHTEADWVAEQIQLHPNAAGILLDTDVSGVAGGSGQSFDWSVIPASSAGKIVLAGGLSEANVAAAIETVRPYAVDVSSGVEQAPGIKSQSSIDEFMRAVGLAVGQ